MTTSYAGIFSSPNPLVTWAEQPLLMLRKTALAFLQGLFEIGDVGCFKWSEDQEATEIYITDEAVIRSEVVGKRPAISVVRGTVAWGKTSLDERQTSDSITGEKTKTDLLSGTLSFNCCSKVDLESEYLAWIVSNSIWLLRDIFLKDTPLHEFGRGNQIGSPSPAGAIVAGDTEGEWINTPVSVSFYFQNSGKVTPLLTKTTLIKSIEARLGLRGSITGPTEQNEGPWTGEDVPPPTPVGVNIGPAKIRGRVIPNIAFRQTLNVKKES